MESHERLLYTALELCDCFFWLLVDALGLNVVDDADRGDCPLGDELLLGMHCQHEVCRC